MWLSIAFQYSAHSLNHDWLLVSIAPPRTHCAWLRTAYEEPLAVASVPRTNNAFNYLFLVEIRMTE